MQDDCDITTLWISDCRSDSMLAEIMALLHTSGMWVLNKQSLPKAVLKIDIITVLTFGVACAYPMAEVMGYAAYDRDLEAHCSGDSI